MSGVGRATIHLRTTPTRKGAWVVLELRRPARGRRSLGVVYGLPVAPRFGRPRRFSWRPAVARG
eukprot:4763629-Lingulodinium_polyedra.AAC.1